MSFFKGGKTYVLVATQNHPTVHAGTLSRTNLRHLVAEPRYELFGGQWFRLLALSIMLEEPCFFFFARDGITVFLSKMVIHNINTENSDFTCDFPIKTGVFFGKSCLFEKPFPFRSRIGCQRNISVKSSRYSSKTAPDESGPLQPSTA